MNKLDGVDFAALQGSGVGSIPMGRSNILKNLSYRLIFHIPKVQLHHWTS